MAETAVPASWPTSLRGIKELPIVRQVLLLAGIAAAVAGGVAVFNWSQKPAQVELYADLSGKDASDAADALRTAGVVYELDPVSGALTVPADKVHQARLLLAAQGLPRSGAQGFEMMQQDQGFGVSNFMEGARYNHALETELSRSVALLAPVKAARVHLAIPKPSAFARPNEGASASVLVELHSGRTLEGNQVQAIVHMVASSVPNLAPARVTVVDQFGRLLSRNGDEADGMGVSTEQFDHTRRVEADYVRRIEQLLGPIAGPGKLSTQVSAEMDFSVTEEARETYAPEKSTVRSEQTSEQTTRGPVEAQGVPGALSNQPPQAIPALPLNTLVGQPSTGASANSSKSQIRNYEVDRTVSHTRQQVGRLKKLSIAVLLDDLPRTDAKGDVKLQPLGEDELKKLEALVKDAVGFDSARGDRVSVQNVSFLPSSPLEAAEDLPIWQQPQVQTLARHGFGLLAIVVLIFAALRPALKVLLGPQPARALTSSGGAVLLPADGGGPQSIESRRERQALGAAPDDEDEPPASTAPYDRKLHAARAAVTQDPKRVAQVVKGWLAEDGGA
ncbi:MAG: flagellar basal-body MS-ring/collar protein FliF [Panacagrimonas sp.]